MQNNEQGILLLLKLSRDSSIFTNVIGNGRMLKTGSILEFGVYEFLLLTGRKLAYGLHRYLKMERLILSKST